MSRKASPAYIGAFVVGAVILAVVGVLIFGSGSYFKERYEYVAFFSGSIKGLDVGAPVELRGVKVGTVKDINLEFNVEELNFRIPVLLEFEPERVSMGIAEVDPYKHFDQLIERGLRAQLQLQSVVTGQLMVALDFHPDKPAVLMGGYGEYREIPTIPTTKEELTKTLANIPFEELFNRLLSTVASIEELVSSGEITKSLQSIQMVMKETRKLVNNVDEQIVPLSTNLEQATIAARNMVEQVDKTLVLVEDILAEDSAPRSKINKALEEFADAARSMRLLVDYLQRHPEALLRGKKGDIKER
ncbi:MAG: MCE family protein [Deltaproteobacteria bacterium]|nr:MCE family protein [Deltaproteobacteria bacterium]